MQIKIKKKKKKKRDIAGCAGVRSVSCLTTIRIVVSSVPRRGCIAWRNKLLIRAGQDSLHAVGGVLLQADPDAANPDRLES